MADLFWLSDEPWAVIEPFMPRNQPGPERNDDRQIISGILHVLTAGCRWGDCPAAYGPPTTVYNRFNRWSARGFWRAMLVALAKAGWAGDAAALDSTYVKAHRSAHGGKGGKSARHRPVAGRPDHKGPQLRRAHRRSRPPRRPAADAGQRGFAADVTTAPAVLAEAPGRIRRLSADKGPHGPPWATTPTGCAPRCEARASRR